MKKWSDKLDKRVHFASAYRQSHHIPEVGIDAVATTFGSNSLTLQMKIDGENNIFEYEGGKLTLANKYGTLRQDIKPLSKDFEELMKKQGVEHLLGAGELYALSPKGEKLPLNQVMSIIKAPRSSDDESRIMLGIFDLLEVDHKPVEGSYYERILFMNALLGDAVKNVHTVFSVQGDTKVLRDLWEKNVLGPNRWEGIIVRTDASTWKVKYVGTLDCAVVGAIKGEGKYVGSLGSLVLALMDKDGNYLYCGKCGTGFNDIERAEWWKWVQANKASEGAIERESVVFVKPERVIECGYSFIATHPTQTIKWTGSGYVSVPDKIGGVMQTPRMYRLRDDKSGLKYDDVRIEQMPLDTPKEEMTEEQIRKRRLEEQFAKIRKRAGLVKSNPAVLPEGTRIQIIEKGHYRMGDIAKIISANLDTGSYNIKWEKDATEGVLYPDTFYKILTIPEDERPEAIKVLFDALASYISNYEGMMPSDKLKIAKEMYDEIGYKYNLFDEVFSPSTRVTLHGGENMSEEMEYEYVKENPISYSEVEDLIIHNLHNVMVGLMEERRGTGKRWETAESDLSLLYRKVFTDADRKKFDKKHPKMAKMFNRIPSGWEHHEMIYVWMNEMWNKYKEDKWHTAEIPVFLEYDIKDNDSHIPNYSGEWAGASPYFVDRYSEYKQFENAEWHAVPDDVKEEFISWYQDEMDEARYMTEDNPTIPSWYWVTGRAIPDVRYYE